MPLSKQKIKLIHSLESKKYRKSFHVFVAEGNKLVNDLFDAQLICKYLFATPSWFLSNPKLLAEESIEISETELKKISSLKTPQEVLAVFYQPDYDAGKINLSEQLVLALDGIQDPGNLGTIIRIADWFGIEHVVCSPETVDVFNSKTIQATMGAIARIKVYYMPLIDFIRKEESILVYGTFLEGNNIYQEELASNGIIIMGNEGNGISKELIPFITNNLFIPNFPAGRTTSESLNVASATSIICSEFRRRNAMMI